ncbi:MAG: hypothetical protein PUB69_02105 [Desulfovibrionaceae bacterium]|nr:hypothetical protein [Desulfovibrionaceae bacterium]
MAKRAIGLMTAILLSVCCTASAVSDWRDMPAGARIAYIGIHGGTVPVSLLAAGDGEPMIALVGLTGNDFVRYLRSRGELQETITLPDDRLRQRPDRNPVYETDVKTLPTGVSLKAGSEAGDIPVIYATGDAFEEMSLLPSTWEPFGLTERALSSEGAVKILSASKRGKRNFRTARSRTNAVHGAEQ